MKTFCNHCKKERPNEEEVCLDCFPFFKFWAKYMSADEIEQHKLLETLPLEMDESGLFIKSIGISLLKSYIDDAMESVRLRGD